jgi:hypothetical protein
MDPIARLHQQHSLLHITQLALELEAMKQGLIETPATTVEAHRRENGVIPL